MSTGRNYEVGAEELKDALAILHREQRHLMPTKWQALAFKLLKLGVYLLGGIGIASLVVWGLVYFDLASWPSFGPTTRDVVAAHVLESLGGLLTIFLVMVGGITPVIVALVALLLINLPLLEQFRRHRRLVRRLHLEPALQALWKTELRRKGFTRLLMILAGVLAALFVVLGLLLVWLTDAQTALTAGAPVLLLAFTAGTAVLTVVFMRRREAHLGAVDQLLSSLEAHGEATESGDSVQVPGGTYEQIARIERRQITRDRAKSIRHFESAESSRFMVLKSNQARRTQAALASKAKLAVQDAIDALAEHPHLGEGDARKVGGLRTHEVPSEALTIEYLVDEAEGRIQILALRPSSGESPREVGSQ